MSKNRILIFLFVIATGVGVWFVLPGRRPAQKPVPDPNANLAQSATRPEREGRVSSPAPPGESSQTGHEVTVDVQSVGEAPDPGQPGLSRLPELNSPLKRGSPPLQDEVSQFMQQALYSADPEERESAVTELAALDPTPRVMQTLMQALNDRDEAVRLQVVLAFEDFEQLEVVPVLRRIAERDPSGEVRDAAADATEFLTNLASRTRR